MKAKVQDELKQHFRPEFLNRVDDIIVFPALTEDEIVDDRRPDDRQARRAAARQGHGHRAHPARPRTCSPSGATTPCWVRGRCAGRSSVRSRTCSRRRSSSARCVPARSSWSTPRARATRPSSPSWVRRRRRCPRSRWSRRRRRTDRRRPGHSTGGLRTGGRSGVTPRPLHSRSCSCRQLHGRLRSRQAYERQGGVPENPGPRPSLCLEGSQASPRQASSLCQVPSGGCAPAVRAHLGRAPDPDGTIRGASR